MTSFNMATAHITDKEVVEDLNYVNSKVQELVGIFNGMNRHKGLQILGIGFNTITDSMELQLGKTVRVH